MLHSILVLLEFEFEGFGIVMNVAAVGRFNPCFAGI